MERFGLDPVRSSNLILTAVTDVLGLIAFLGFAVLYQQYPVQLISFLKKSSMTSHLLNTGSQGCYISS